MIRINLLAADQKRGGKKGPRPFASVNSKLTVGCTLILLAAGTFSGSRYYKAWKESQILDTEISDAQQETSRLHGIIQQVQQFEQRKAQLQQRVVLIEQLRKGQTGPVHMLDQISRALPPMLWLTELKQAGADITIEGRSTTLTGISDFAANLEATGYFKRSVDIASTQTETISQAPGQLFKFSIKAQFLPAIGTVAAAKPGPSDAASPAVAPPAPPDAKPQPRSTDAAEAQDPAESARPALPATLSALAGRVNGEPGTTKPNGAADVLSTVAPAIKAKQAQGTKPADAPVDAAKPKPEGR